MTQKYSVGMVVPKVNGKGKVVGKGLWRLSHKCFKSREKAENFARKNQGKEMVRTGKYYTKIEGKLKVMDSC